MQSPIVKQKLIDNNLKKYGVEHVLQLKSIREALTLSNLTKYGVEHASQSEEIKHKIKNTCLDKYGVEHVSQCEDFKNNIKNTCLDKYGVEYAFQAEEIKNKIKRTCLEKYGVENVSQNHEIMEKIIKHSFLKKEFMFPSGKIALVQGYEPFAINDLLNIEHISELDIIVGVGQVPVIWYKDNNNKLRRHFVDIFIPSKKLCIEVKSTWTLKKDNVFLKQQYGKELGYNYEIWVYNCKGTQIQRYT